MQGIGGSVGVRLNCSFAGWRSLYHFVEAARRRLAPLMTTTRFADSLQLVVFRLEGQ